MALSPMPVGMAPKKDKVYRCQGTLIDEIRAVGKQRYIFTVHYSNFVAMVNLIEQ